LKLSYHYVRKSYFSPDATDAKIGRNTLPLAAIAPDASTLAQLKKKDQLLLRGPIHIDQKATLHFTKQQQPVAPISVSLSRDYASYASTYELKDDQLSAERSYTINAFSLPVTRQRDLEAFLSAVEQDFKQQVAVTLSPGTVESADSTALNDAAQARLDVDDYKGAEELALKAIQADPKSPYAWNNLGRAYLGEGDKLDQAESAFRKQIEINPYDQYAYNNLGRTLLQLHRTDEAVAAFRKQIQIVPLDQYAHMNLGRTLLTMKKYDEAIAELEKAVQIRPNDPGLKVALAEAYQRSGKTDKASAMMAKLPFPTPHEVAVTGAYEAVFNEDRSPDTVLQTSRDTLQQSNRSFPSSEPADKGRATATVVPLMWARMGWAYFRQNDPQNAEHYLHAAWAMSQFAPVALRLGQVYEKESKKDLAVRTYAEAMSGEGSKQGVRESLVRLVGERKADALVAKLRGDLSESRTVWLSKKSSYSGSARLQIVFSHGVTPEKVIFIDGKVALVDHYRAAIKAAKFPIVYPDDTPQYVVRKAIVYCGSVSGCSVVLMPSSLQMSVGFSLQPSSKQ
ncbi:MAG: tetratricopeptide repeat protein, partial [Candidatus Angelobacter sp.]